MNREELIAVISFAFFLTFVLGWLLRWAYGGLNKINSADMSEIDDLANRLHEAEQAKDLAETQLQEREWELQNKLGQVEAELSSVMEGLGEARREAESLREQLGQG